MTPEEIQLIIQQRAEESEAAMKAIQDKFNSVQDFWNEKYSQEENPEKAIEIQLEWDKAVEEAQLEFDSSIEDLVQKEDSFLLKDQQDSQKEIEEFAKEDEEKFLAKLAKYKEEKEERYKALENEKDEEIPDELPRTIQDELKFLKEEGFTAKMITKRYNKLNINKNGFSTLELYKFVGGTGSPLEAIMAELIFKVINK